MPSLLLLSKLSPTSDSASVLESLRRALPAVRAPAFFVAMRSACILSAIWALPSPRFSPLLMT
jgi:hypothetical protein